MRRLIVTGSNGAGKSYMAAQLAAVRPEVPVISFDAVKLTRNWQQRPKSEIDGELLRIVQMDSWILEGGPSLLPYAVDRADGIICLDPPMGLRAWRLIIRPLRNMGRTRPELPRGNVDWPWKQYRFAIRSLRNQDRFRASISNHLADAGGVRIWHIRDTRDIGSVIAEWRNSAT
ncbi:DNA topology modulation protein FlaR [Rhizobium tumorigenes]|uniref:DNA topology modulation protein FlaR n=1 Tax=Rhizobium tumorigenes TaxID=2041385 RepID=A0AAF1KMR2_9HYPH|nr:DNA topology modulation protein FlaR [Rhizobium tumorigenes]WFR97971.1 DNA topology modulation protein FlaR [Rhizobium tumorigenes]